MFKFNFESVFPFANQHRCNFMPNNLCVEHELSRPSTPPLDRPLSTLITHEEQVMLDNLFPEIGDVISPDSKDYAWRYIPHEPARRVLVQINQNGEKTEFNQFKPSRIKFNPADCMTRFFIDSEWMYLNNKIWVLEHSNS